MYNDCKHKSDYDHLYPMDGGGLPQHLVGGFGITILTKRKPGVDMEVDSIVGVGEKGDYLEVEPYLKCSIKWDGCSHFWFGDEGEKDGYLHICGHGDFSQHVMLMSHLYSLAFQIMEGEVD